VKEHAHPLSLQLRDLSGDQKECPLSEDQHADGDGIQGWEYHTFTSVLKVFWSRALGKLPACVSHDSVGWPVRFLFDAYIIFADQQKLPRRRGSFEPGQVDGLMMMSFLICSLHNCYMTVTETRSNFNVLAV